MQVSSLVLITFFSWKTFWNVLISVLCVNESSEKWRFLLVSEQFYLIVLFIKPKFSLESTFKTMSSCKVCLFLHSNGLFQKVHEVIMISKTTEIVYQRTTGPLGPVLKKFQRTGPFRTSKFPKGPLRTSFLSRNYYQVFQSGFLGISMTSLLNPPNP